MEFNQALEVVNRAVNPKLDRPLTEVEVALLYGAWHNLNYDRIADRSGYSINYLQRDLGPKFWKLLSNALGRQVNKTNLRGILINFDPVLGVQPQVQTVTDWGEAIDTSTFHGRSWEIETLTEWIVRDRCRLMAIVGMGGMGKSALAAKVARLLQGNFEFVIWRSLRNAPPLATLLSELVAFLSQQQDIQATPERFLYWLQQHRCLARIGAFCYRRNTPYANEKLKCGMWVQTLSQQRVKRFGKIISINLSNSFQIRPISQFLTQY